jgi:hypothetical protein
LFYFAFVLLLFLFLEMRKIFGAGDVAEKPWRPYFSGIS